MVLATKSWIHLMEESDNPVAADRSGAEGVGLAAWIIGAAAALVVEIAQIRRLLLVVGT